MQLWIWFSSIWIIFRIGTASGRFQYWALYQNYQLRQSSDWLRYWESKTLLIESSLKVCFLSRTGRPFWECFIQTKPNEVKRKKYDGGNLGALELVNLLHKPALRSSHIHRAQHFAFSPFFTSFFGQIFHLSLPVTPFFLPWLPSPLTILAPSQLPCRAEARGRRGGEGNPSRLLIGRNRRHPCSHWSPRAAGGALGEGTDCKCGQKGVSKNVHS